MKPDRKQELVAQAALHRRRMGQARQEIADGLQPGALAKGAGGLALAGLSLLRSKKGGGAPAGLAALLPLAAPLAMRGLALLGKSKAPAAGVSQSGSRLRKLLAVGALGALAAYAVKKVGGRGRES